jgi:hypothetical protein
MLIGVSIVQGGAAYPYFAPSFFSYICGVDVCSITASQDEIPEFEIHQALQKITSVEDSTQLQDVAQNESEMLLSCGFTKPFATLTLKDIPSIIESVTLHTTILKVKAELDDMVKGLDDAGVLEMLRKHPDFFRPLFVYNKDNSLTADKLMALFEHRVFSQQGSSEHVKEQATYMLFSDFLEELEGGIEQTDGEKITLHDCLSFFTGARDIPPTGFDDMCTLNFNGCNVFPTASTCSLSLTLPTLYHDCYPTFKEKMLYVFFNHGGFGLC